MENQLEDQPLKWIERIKHGLDLNKGYFVSHELLTKDILRKIFANAKERKQRLKNVVDMDVLFDGKECLLRLGANFWKLVAKSSPFYHSILNAIKTNDSPNHDKKMENFFSLYDELEYTNNKLKESLGKQESVNFNSSDSIKWYSTIIKTILECNKTLLSIIKYLKYTRSFRKNWTRDNNIRKYKKNNIWIPDNEWNKLTWFQKVMKRWNFSDRHQCLVPWEEKKLSKEELRQFQEAKIEWRTKRKNELNGNTARMKIFDKFCHARIINNKLINNLDATYNEMAERQSNIPSNNTKNRRNQIKDIHAN